MKKRADGRYSRSIVTGYDPVTGKQLRKAFYATTKVELEKKVREWQELHEKGFDQEPDMTMAELIDKWLEYKTGTMKQQSFTRYVSQAKQLKAEFGPIKVTKLSLSNLVNYRNKMAAEGRQKTFNRHLTTLRQILDYGIKLNVIISNVGRKIGKNKVTKNKRRAFTEAEKKIILSAELPDFQKAFVYVLFYSGLRRGEALALTAEDIDLKRRKIKVHSTVVDGCSLIQEGTKTIAGMRNVPISDELYAVLEPYVKEVGSGLLFSTASGKMFQGATWHSFWTGIMTDIFGEDYPKDITPHVFRHNYCSDLCKAGVPVRTAMYLMGHSSMNMTMEIYSHVSYEDIDIAPLEAYYNRRESVRESNA